MTFRYDLDALTPENLAALAAIDHYCRDSGSGPTMRQLAALLGLRAHTAARRQLLRLEELDLIRFQRVGTKRQIAAHPLRVTPAGRRVLQREARARRGGTRRQGETERGDTETRGRGETLKNALNLCS